MDHAHYGHAVDHSLGLSFALPAASCIQAHILKTIPALQKKNRLKHTMVPTISSMEVPTKNMPVRNAAEGMEPKSNTDPLQMSSEVRALPMQ